MRAEETDKESEAVETEEESGATAEPEACDGSEVPASVPAERQEQLRKMNPEEMHKRAAAATANSPLRSFDVRGCFIYPSLRFARLRSFSSRIILRRRR